MLHSIQRAAFIALGCFTLLAPARATAQESQGDFFKGKTVTFAVGALTGGFLDLYARPVAEFLGRHIPGKPNVVVAYMPGAASKLLARHVYAVAPKDGTFIGAIFPSVSLEPLFDNNELKGFDPSKFNFIGSAQEDVSLCVFRRDANVRTLEDLQTKEVPVGVTAPGSTTFDFPQMTNGLLGTKFRLVKGYPGGAELKLALERDEVKGVCPQWSTGKVYFPHILEGALDLVVVARGDLDHPDLVRAGVPKISGLAKTQAQRDALDLYLAQYKFAAPYILPPGVPDARVKILRDAFMETLSDPDFLAMAKQRQMEVNAMSGEAVQAAVRKMYATSAESIKLLKTALARGQ